MINVKSLQSKIIIAINALIFLAISVIAIITYQKTYEILLVELQNQTQKTILHAHDYYLKPFILEKEKQQADSLNKVVIELNKLINGDKTLSSQYWC